MVSPEIYNTYRKYASSGNATLAFDFEDFYLRRFQPQTLDLAISIWVLGKREKDIDLT
jgi:hypothetical protein